MLLDEAINQHFKRLNDNEQVALTFITNHKAHCSGLTLTELSKECSVSSSFIMRLTQKLGYTGFSEFKYQLKQESKLLDQQPTTIIETIQNDLAETLRLMSSRFFNDLPQLLDQARTIYTYGSGYGQRTILAEFRRGMIHCNKFVIDLPTSKEVHLNARRMEKGDLIFIVSMSGDVPNIEQDLNILKSNEVTVISITQFQTNLLASLATQPLYLQSTPMLNINPKNTYTSYTTLCLLLDTIVKFYLSYQGQQPHQPVAPSS